MSLSPMQDNIGRMQNSAILPVVSGMTLKESAAASLRGKLAAISVQLTKDDTAYGFSR